ncbi:hypothetical protein SAMN05660350_01240 [Geodermatophilus obscurus]|uniref:Lipid droplet-associated protein n=1 Tax=Geodermatophilus obscurus TaxID=1861 RepID=A0A1M7T0W7_9ACTN|nr:hypothetical protein [Geodermatophilus obscurus]SHN64415.1 hypothetical protein SAMN05660350_01240 [Geodermatophilus obscurus]
MSREIPQVVRAVVGLAATVIDDTLQLPRTLPGLPVRVIGLAMQATMKLQQHYSGLVARGDEVFTGLRGESEPGLATFDEDMPEPAAGRTSAFDRAPGFDQPTSFDRASAPVTDEEIAEEVAALIDDEVSGLPADPAPEEVVEALADISDEVAAAGLDLDRTEPGLSTEDALETALLEADGAPDSALVDGGTGDTGTVDTDEIAESPTTPPASLLDADATEFDVHASAATDAPAPSDPGGSPVGEVSGAPDVTTDVDVLTPDGGVATVEGTVTDEGVAAPEAPTDGEAAAPQAPADEGAGATDVTTDVDVLTPDGGVATVEGTVTDEGVAAPEAPTDGEAAAPQASADETPGAPAQADEQDSGVDEALGSEASDADTRPSTEGAPAGDDRDATGSGDEVVTAAGAQVDDAIGTGEDTSAPAATDEGTTDDVVATDESGTDVAAATGVRTDVDESGTPEDAADTTGAAAGSAPVDGYDSFTVAQLRGRLRGYQLATVADLLAYEEATRAREPYLRMLRNRLEKLERQAVEESPLAPRGA